MKKSASLSIALGLVSAPLALAQMQAMPQPAQDGETPEVATPSSTTGGAESTSGSTSESASDLSSGGSNGMRSEAGPDQQPPPSPIARLKPVTQDEVTYLCGGVGEEESSYMKQEAKDYNLMLTFATRSGAYLADVDVDIRDAKGNPVLQTSCDSPILLVELPRGGSYRVHAETAGYALNKTVRVGGGKRAQSLASAVLSWPQQVADTGSAATATGSSGGNEGGGARSGTR